MKKQKFEVFFESGESVTVSARTEDDAIAIAESLRPNEDFAFVQPFETELQVVA